MELINNIWMALSTPNEIIIKLLNFPLICLENFLLMLLFLILSNKKSSKKSKVLYVTLSSIINIIFFNIFSQPIYVFMNFATFILLSSKIFKIHILNTMVYVLATALIFNLISALVLNPFLAITHLSAEQLLVIPEVAQQINVL